MVIIMNENLNNENNETSIEVNKKTQNSFFKPNKIVAIIIYAVMIFLVAGFITIGLAIIFGFAKHLDVMLVIETLSASDLSIYTPDYIKVNAMAQGWGNLIGYLIATAAVIFYMRDDIALDFKDLTGENKKKHAIWIPIFAVGFLIITLCVDTLVGLIPGVSESTNQATIESILNNGGLVPMVISTVLLAPVVEELIYRKAIFSLAKGYGTVTCYVLSIVIFTLPHMLTSDMSNIGIWLLQCIPYATAGGLLCLVYHKSNYNVYASICAHMLNNLVACILVFI